MHHYGRWVSGLLDAGVGPQASCGWGTTLPRRSIRSRPWCIPASLFAGRASGRYRWTQSGPHSVGKHSPWLRPAARSTPTPVPALLIDEPLSPSPGPEHVLASATGVRREDSVPLRSGATAALAAFQPGYLLTPTTGWDPSKGETLGAFVNYALTLGQQSAPSFGYATLGQPLEQFGINEVASDVPGAVPMTADEQAYYTCGDLTPADVAAGNTTPSCGSGARQWAARGSLRFAFPVLALAALGSVFRCADARVASTLT